MNQNLIKFFNEYSKLNLGDINKNIKLSDLTTIKIGGPAEILIEPYNKETLIKSVKLLLKYNLEYTVIGNGSNLLAGDKGYSGVLIRLKNLKKTSFLENDIYVEGGYSLVKLSHLCANKGLSGLEFASGIPATIGGAVYMNAGAFSSEISNVLRKIEFIDDYGNLREILAEDANYSVRTSIFQDKKWIIVAAYLKLEPKNKSEIYELMSKCKEYRQNTQPYNCASIGSVFFPPPKEYAGSLIEELKLKGFKIGGIEISEKHANHFINRGNASGKDFLEMMEHVNKLLLESYGVYLASEVKTIGRF